MTYETFGDEGFSLLADEEGLESALADVASVKEQRRLRGEPAMSLTEAVHRANEYLYAEGSPYVAERHTAVPDGVEDLWTISYGEADEPEARRVAGSLVVTANGHVRPLEASTPVDVRAAAERCDDCDLLPCECAHRAGDPSTRRTSTRTGPLGLDQAIREFVLTSHEAGIRENWGGWLDRITENFSRDRHSVRGAWNRVNNALQREWLLIDDPDDDLNGPMMPPAHFPQVRRLSTTEAIAEVEQLITSGGWTVGEPGLRLSQVWRRIPNVVYISIFDALHEMNGRDYLVTTTAPSGKSSQYWYVKP